MYFSAKPKSSLTFVASYLGVFVDIFVSLFSLTHLLPFPFPLLSTCKFMIFTMGKEAQLYVPQILRSTERGQGLKLGWSESSLLAPLQAGTNFKGSHNLGAVAQMNPKPLYVLPFPPPLSSCSLNRFGNFSLARLCSFLKSIT